MPSCGTAAKQVSADEHGRVSREYRDPVHLSRDAGSSPFAAVFLPPPPYSLQIDDVQLAHLGITTQTEGQLVAK